MLSATSNVSWIIRDSQSGAVWNIRNCSFHSTPPVPQENVLGEITKKHSLFSKWKILFDKSPEWISFKPQLGFKVYPCYSCKNMFSSKLTFQDHINRRVVIIKYKCTNCTNTFTFYNRCSFLLHARKHFSLSEGQINLANVDISLLPVDLAGFARHESIPFLYDEDEEYSDGSSYVNCQFYSADDTEAGKQIITMKPFNLVFHYSEGTNNVLLILKQITLNVPLCEFVTQGYERSKKVIEPEITMTEQPEPEIKQEVEDIEEFTIPVISKIESLNSEVLRKLPQCPECATPQEMPMVSHFLANNKPLDETLSCYVCKYVAPTKCSLKAHMRTHENASPFVCPECGKVFKSAAILTTHMDDVCFHLSKQVRFRCPALKCGKLFVMPNTYAAHFANHLQCVYRCSACNASFLSHLEFAEHAKVHQGCTFVKSYNCMVCMNAPPLSEERSGEHITWHLQDRERCVYILTCRLCRSYFRSSATYSVHKQRCQKSEKVQPAIIIANCQFCGQKIQYREKDNFKTCFACRQINNCRKSPQDDKKSCCMLCKEEFPNQETKKAHSKLCKYNNPIVTIHSLNNEPKDSDETSSSEKLSASNSDIDSKPNLDSSNDSLKDPPKSKKRKRSSLSVVRVKKSIVVVDESDLQAEKAICFDGTYYCKLCDYKNTERSEFHEHIVGHRDVSTSYQCMECGECFVVKPSLVKHLAHFHKIVDTNLYFASNDCYDKFAIQELQNQQKRVPGEHKGPVKENQCTVCLEQFEDALSLSKHFRIHGLAFLLKKTK